MGDHDPPELGERALQSPAADPEPPARPQRPRQLAGSELVPGREHAAEGREHYVEAPVLHRQRLGVARDPLDLEAGVGGEPAPDLEQLWGEVDADHPGAGRGRAERGIAAPAGDVEHPFAGLHAEAVDDPRADLPEHRARDRVVVAPRPDRALCVLALGKLHRGHRRPGGLLDDPARTIEPIGPVSARTCSLMTPRLPGHGRASIGENPYLVADLCSRWRTA
jgi:hypothetical protein